MYEAILEGENWDSVKKALAIEELLELNQYDGKEKGNKIKEIRQMLVQEFALGIMGITQSRQKCREYILENGYERYSSNTLR